MLSTESMWNLKAAEKFVGRKIVGARYMTADEASGLGWMSRPLALILDNDTVVVPQSDDEGNEGGVLYLVGVSEDNDEVFPVL
jgi:hypothetical protein